MYTFFFYKSVKKFKNVTQGSSLFHINCCFYRHSKMKKVKTFEVLIKLGIIILKQNITINLLTILIFSYFVVIQKTSKVR